MGLNRATSDNVFHTFSARKQAFGQPRNGRESISLARQHPGSTSRMTARDCDILAAHTTRWRPALQAVDL